MNNVRAIQKINEAELVSGSKKSWHDMYSHSAYIFIGGLDYGLTEGDVLAVFSQYGEIININLVKDRSTGKSKGFCFLCYDDQRSTILAVDNFNGIKLCGRTLRVDHVNEYRRPKDESGNEIIEKGCAPRTPTPSPTPSPSPEPPEQPKQKAKKTKDKKKKKKLKPKKKFKDSEPDSDVDSSGNEMDIVRNPRAKKTGKERATFTKDEDHEQREHRKSRVTDGDRFGGRSGEHVTPSPPPRHKFITGASRSEREPKSRYAGPRHSYRDERRGRHQSRSTSRERRQIYGDERSRSKTGRSRSRSRDRSEHHTKHVDRSKHVHR